MELYSWSNELLPHLNLFSSSSVETGKILSMQQSPMSNASQELHRKFHFCSVCRSCTMILATYLKMTDVYSRKKQLKMILVLKNVLVPLKLSACWYQAGWLPELSCHSRMPCSSPRKEGVVIRNISTAPRSNRGFLWSVRWCGSLFPSAPRSVAITWRTNKLDAISGEKIDFTVNHFKALLLIV